MFRIHTSIIVLFLTAHVCFAGDTKPFRPVVTPFLQSFTHMRVDLHRDTVIFKQEKVIFGLNTKLNANWSFRIGVDLVGMNRPFLKPTVLTYQKDRWTVDAGILFTSEMDLATTQFWANRFIDRVPADVRLHDPTADLGLRVAYRWNEYLAADVSVVSGSGYQQLNKKYHPQPAFRFILSPFKILKASSYMSLRKSEDVTETTVNGFVHLQTDDRWKATCEYHHKNNYRFNRGQALNVASIYATYNFTSWLGLVGRYDRIWSKSDLPGEVWNVAEDGQAVICGLIFRCFPSVRVSVDYWNRYPTANHLPKEDWIYFCLEFRYR